MKDKAQDAEGLMQVKPKDKIKRYKVNPNRCQIRNKAEPRIFVKCITPRGKLVIENRLSCRNVRENPLIQLALKSGLDGAAKNACHLPQTTHGIKRTDYELDKPNRKQNFMAMDSFPRRERARA